MYNDLVLDPSRWNNGRRGWRRNFFSTWVKTEYWRNYQQSFATFDILDLLEVFEAKGNELTRLVQGHMYHFPGSDLTEAPGEPPYHLRLNTTQFQEYEKVLESGALVKFEGDAIDKKNSAWLWSHEYKSCDLYAESTSTFEDDSLSEGLRRFGYVFWDHDRLASSGLLGKDPEEVSQSTLMRFLRPLIHEKPSVEDRIKKLWLSQ